MQEGADLRRPYLLLVEVIVVTPSRALATVVKVESKERGTYEALLVPSLSIETNWCFE